MNRKQDIPLIVTVLVALLVVTLFSVVNVANKKRACEQEGGMYLIRSSFCVKCNGGYA